MSNDDPGGSEPAHACVPDRLEAVLCNGTSVEIRAVQPTDRARIASLFDRMSPDSIHHRFFGAKRGLSEADLTFLVGNGSTHVALAVVALDGVDETFLGVGRYVLLDPPGTAEVAFEVADAEHHHGIATLLLEHLSRLARGSGVHTFRAEVEAGNPAMLDVFAHSGFAVHVTCSQGIYRADTQIDHDPRFAAAVGGHQRVAAAAARARCAS